MKQLDVAWAAGFFDGEGCVYFQRGKNPAITVTQKDPEALTRFRKIFGIGTIYPISRTNPCCKYGAYGIDAVLVLSLILPYLTVKKLKAVEAIKAQESCRPKARNSQYKNKTKIKIRLDKERLLEIVDLRRRGFTFVAIGVRYNISRQRAHQLYILSKTQKELTTNPHLS